MSPSFDWYDIERDAPAWDGLVARVGGDLFQRSSLLRAERERHERLRAVLVHADGAPVAAIGGFVHRRHPSRFRTPSFPALQTTGDDQLVTALLHWLSSEGVPNVELGSFSSGVEGYDLGSSRGRPYRRLEFLIDLTRSDEELWRELSSSHRRQIRRAGEQGVELEAVRHGAGHLLAEARGHWAERSGGRFSVLDRVRSRRRHARTVRTLADSGRTYVLTDSARNPLAIAYILLVGSESFYKLGGSWPRGYQMGASIAMIWKLVGELRRSGVRTFNLGGVPAAAVEPGQDQHGVYRFKRGFGARECERLSLSVGGA